MKNIEQLITELGNKLKKHNLTIVTAESCTGGGLSYFITLNQACSSLLERGYIAYSNKSKEDLLDVKSESIQLFGAVSKEVAIEMAKGALENSSAQVSIGITGIAGVDKVENQGEGIVWICFDSIFQKSTSFKKVIKGNRRDFIHDVLKSCVTELITFLDKLK